MKTTPKSPSPPKQIASCFRGGIDDLVFWSFRYFLGRMTIHACVFAESLATAWPLLQDRTRILIQSELEDAFRRDDSSKFGYMELGMACDRKAWEKVRARYMEPQDAAKQ